MSDIVAPKGFSFKAVSAAIKKPGRLDVAVIFSDRPTAAAAVFTTNKVKAAPVLDGIKKIRSGAARAIVVNSGNANACTGSQGIADVKAAAETAAEALGVKPGEVLVSSTGVIGLPLPMDRLLPGVKSAASALDGTLDDVARAIMTTDTFAKAASRTVKLGGRRVTISGVAKGSGMIAPNMATMLAFIITDAAVDAALLSEALKNAVKYSFNRITVDGDRSTNDTAVLLANGAAGNAAIQAGTPDAEKFMKVVGEVTYELSRMIAKDGEGATKLIEVCVKGAKNERDAERAAMAIANSPLVKTAVNGRDANWGRILCAAGYSGAALREDKIAVLINKVKIVSGGLAAGKDAQAAKAMEADQVNITIDLGVGAAEACVLSCDLTEKYIRINAEYRT